MAANRIPNQIGRLLLAACVAVNGLMASEYHGVVTSNGLPVPGATVNAVKDDKKVATTTDENGAFSFTDLADGVWSLQVDMLGFVKFSKEVGVESDAPAPAFELKPMNAAELKAALDPPPAAPAASSTPTPTATATASPNTPSTPAATAPTTPGKPAANGTAPAPASAQSTAPGRGNNGRPSIRAAQGGRGGFTRLDVNASGDAGVGSNENEAGMNSDLAQSSNDAFVVNGSISSAAGMPQQNDWGGPGGPGGMFGGPGGMGMGGPGGPNMDPNGMQTNGDMTAGAGGRGGRGAGGPGGGPGGGGPGMMGMGGGPGGGGFGGRGGGGGFGGPGGRGGGGGRDGRGGRGGRANANSFGNGRRNARMRYNGNVAFILDNSVWDARPFSLTGQDTPKPSAANARMTAIFGGPLKIPHVLSGEHTTFNLNYQFTRARTGSTQSALVPTAAERSGDFSQALTTSGVVPTIYQSNGSPFPNNQIPQNLFSSQALGLLAYTPLPNFSAPNSRYNYQVGLVGVNNQDNINARINHTFNTKNQMFGSFAYQRADGQSHSLYIDPSTGANFLSGNHQSAYNTGLNWTYHFTTRLINTVGLTFSRNNSNSTPYFANRTNLSAALGITGNDQAPAYWGPPGLSFSNGFSVIGDGSTNIGRAQTTALSESVRWFHGTHQFTFGGDVRRVENNPITQQNARGGFTYNGTYTSLAGATNTGYDFADFLLGKPDSDSIAYGNADKYYRNGWFDSYVNDNWQLSPNFSVQLGLRWDYQLPTTEVYGRLVNMEIGQGFTSASAICASAPANGAPCTLAGQVGLPDSLIRGNTHEFQPRAGIAWKPWIKKSTVVRGGWGIYYNTSVFQGLVTSMAQQAPFSLSYINPNPTGMFFCTPGQAGCNLTGSNVTTYAVDPNFHIGYSQNWQLSVQQNLSQSLVATVTYSGAKGTHQPQSIIPNSAPPGGSYVCSAGFTCPTNYTYVTTGGNSISNSLWLQLQRRFRSGLSWSAIYSHVSSIDDVASLGGRGASPSQAAQNWQDLEAERAHSSGIRANTLGMNMQYSTGMGAQGGALMKGFKGSLFREWTFSMQSSVASGSPETPSVVARNLAGTGISGPLRAFYWGGPVFLDGVLNPAAFTQPLAGQYGNAGRNIIDGPSMFSLNGSAERTFRVGERRSINLQFRATNMLNHVTFGSWNTTVGSSQFGALQAPGQMRDLTATLRFRF